jgi:hypothetical protein
VQETLAHIEPTNPATITQQLVDAAVARALTQWRNQQRIAETIEQVCRVYRILDSGYKAKMQAAAASAVAQMRDGASVDEMLTAAENHVTPLVRLYEHARTCQEVVDKVLLELPGGAISEWEEGKEMVREALAKLPIGVSRRELEQASSKALAPIRSAIAARERAELSQQVDFRFYGWSDKLRARAKAEISEALNELPVDASQSELGSAREQVIERCQRIHERREQKSRLIDFGVRQIRPFVNKLTADYEFDADAYTIEHELEEPIREILAEELRGEETDDQVASLVRRSVREELDIR